MVIVEKNEKKLSVVELLLLLTNEESNKGVINRIPAKWQERTIGKYSVLFYVGHDTFRVHSYEPDAILGTINYVFSSFESTDIATLFWCDDGMLLKLIQSQDDDKKKKNQCWRYEKILEKIECSSHIIRIELQEIENILFCINIFYGDAGQMADIAYNNGIKVIYQDAARQCMHEALALPDWLNSLERIQNYYDVNLLAKESNSKRVLFYMDPRVLLSMKELALKKLERIAAMVRARRKLFFCWAESSEVEKYLQLGTLEDRKSYMAVKKIICEYGQVISVKPCSRNLVSEFDIYYGDMSDALDEFIRQGKPVIRQSYNEHVQQRLVPEYQSDSLAMQFVSGCWVDNYYYFSANNGNGLCRVPKGSESVEYISHIPCKSHKGIRNNLFATVVHYDGKLFLLPCEANKVMIFDLNRSEWRSLSLSQEYVLGSESFFTSGIKVDNILWGIPVCYGAIIALDMSKEEISYYSDWSNILLQYITIPQSMHWSGVATLCNNSIYFVATQSPHVISFDMKSKKSKVYKVDVEAQGLGNIVYDDNDFWITTSRRGCGQLLRWRPDAGVSLIVKDIMGKPNASCVAYPLGGYIWAFEYAHDVYVKYDPSNGSIERKEHYLPKELRKGLGIPSIIPQDDGFLIFPNWGELFVKLNPIKEIVETKCFRLDEQGQKKYIKHNFTCNDIDESIFSDDNELAIFLETYRSEDDRNMSIGEKIYREIIELCEQ